MAIIYQPSQIVKRLLLPCTAQLLPLVLATRLMLPAVLLWDTQYNGCIAMSIVFV
nr:MAG TPA: hypothetical protein [Caudoviricetes sp.]